MMIPVVFNDGRERNATRDELQYLIVTKQIMSFKRTAGWVIVGRDKMRTKSKSRHVKKDRRKHTIYPQGYWY
ncbi:hypothetical protein SAMN02745165_03722 [Malonomonas rubra DSM 5091]|uniref:Uncharacterized protein n=1 Tax=Malonomonas rubra DSM 5091 TaxID=1122189 RepID=A0A1M6NVZ5_MALRU|nr:hypothetical protein [Malonomonas rubra]SHJ99818.1 hypothetical protein SAMN02745165_03722 [Malonomonas rubra DSM 5091]